MNRKYAISDLHGMYDLWRQVRDYCDETDKIYFLGDAIDRGNGGIKILQEMIDDPRVVYLMGNHEEMMIDAIKTTENSLWMFNGGRQTRDDFWALPYEDKKKITSFLLSNDLYHMSIYNSHNQIIYLSHSGVSFLCTNASDSDKYLWDRTHFQEPWAGEANAFMVHGHTPVPYLYSMFGLPEDKPLEVFNYCDGHKFDIDLGSFTLDHRLALFDLDALKVEKYFTTEVEKHD